MDSLNAGLQKDEFTDPNATKEDQLADLVFTQPQDGVTPELDQNVTVIAALDKKHDRVSEMEQEIRENRTMSQSVALEAHNLTGGFITSQRPLTMYTGIPTRTGLSYAIENLNGEKKNILVRLYEKLKEYVVKALEWLGKYIYRKPNPMDEKAVDEFFGKYFDRNLKVANGFLVVQKRKEDIFGRLGDVLRRKGVEEAVLDSIVVFGQKILERFEKEDVRFQNLRDKLAASPAAVGMIHNSDYFKSLIQLNSVIERYIAGLVDINSTLGDEEGFKESLSYKTEEIDEFVTGVAADIKNLRDAVEEIAARFSKIHSNKTGTRFADESSKYNIEDFMEDSKYLRSNMNDRNAEQLMISESKFAELEKAYKSVLDNLGVIISRYEEATQKSENDAQNLEKLHGVFREMFAVLNKGSQSVMQYVSTTQQAARAATELSGAAKSFVEGINTYVSAMVGSLPESVRPDVTEYMEGIGFNFSEE